jgi:type II secretory pathway component GspD/PulD (secretin)
MKILPTLLGNGKVLLEVDALVGSFTFKSSGALPDTTDRQVATSLTVGDGQTVVLGGLKQQQSTIVRQRVPILSQIPVLGNLFRRTSRTSSENTLTVLITPRVIAGKDRPR